MRVVCKDFALIPLQENCTKNLLFLVSCFYAHFFFYVVLLLSSFLLLAAA